MLRFQREGSPKGAFLSIRDPEVLTSQMKEVLSSRKINGLQESSRVSHEQNLIDDLVNCFSPKDGKTLTQTQMELAQKMWKESSSKIILQSSSSLGGGI